MAYAFARQLTGSANAGGPTSLAATVPAAGCAIGSVVFVGVLVGDSANTPTISDPRGNTWAQVGSAAINNTGTRTSHTYLFKSVLTTALQSGDLVTATISGGASAGAAIVAAEWTGGSVNTTVDQTHTGFNTGTAVSAGSITTTVANELLVTVVGRRDTNASGAISFTAGSGWTALTAAGAGSGVPGHHEDAVLQYRIVSSTGTYTGDGTLGNANDDWGAVVGSVYENTPAGPTDDHSELYVSD